MHPDGFHPACLLFPKLTGFALDELAADIKDRGLIEPIVLLHGQVLDGKNRLAACRIAGVKPRFVAWDGDGSLISGRRNQQADNLKVTAPIALGSESRS
jgi:hypothetical protein